MIGLSVAVLGSSCCLVSSAVPGFIPLTTMSFPTLGQLGVERLLEDLALAMSALEVLPWNLFPALLREAIVKRRMEVLKAVVQAWPFACLPLGALMNQGDLEMLQVTLEGLDMLLEQKVWPRRCRLRVIDLRNVFPNNWTASDLALHRACSAVALTDNPAANQHPEMAEQPPFRVVINVFVSIGSLDCGLSHLLQWAETRKGQVQLCCKKLQILSESTSDSTSKVQSILNVLHLDSIQELVVEDLWNHKIMANIVPYLVQMKNLHILSLSKTTMERCTSSALNLHAYLFQLLHPENRKDLITGSRIRYEKLDKVFSPGPLGALLEKVAGTLETLALEHCGIDDAQLSAMLPTLSQCSHLSLFSFYGNPISLATLQNLLRHTARLGQLSHGLYPAPLESCYHQCLLWCEVNQERFSLLWESLVQVLRDIQPAHQIQICTSSCTRCKKREFCSLALSGNCHKDRDQASGGSSSDDTESFMKPYGLWSCFSLPSLLCMFSLRHCVHVFLHSIINPAAMPLLQTGDSQIQLT
ncbi:PRAME family member 8-like [Thomomys bottae]